MTGTPNLRDALIQAAALGCRVHLVRRTGEVRVRPPVGKAVTVNVRRKDCTKALKSLLRHLSVRGA